MAASRSVSDWTQGFDARVVGIDWTDARSVHRACRPALEELYADRELLHDLVDNVHRTPELMRRCEEHPLLYRAVVHHNVEENVQVRLHAAQASTKDLMPHDHKSTFVALILQGGYIHVWRTRRGEQAGDFTSSDLDVGTVSLERPGSCYAFRNSLVHQTVMLPGTVTLFVRGPSLQPRWHSASDMLHLLEDYEPPKADGSEHRGSTALGPASYAALQRRLVADGVIHPRPPEKEKS